MTATNQPPNNNPTAYPTPTPPNTTPSPRETGLLPPDTNPSQADTNPSPADASPRPAGARHGTPSADQPASEPGGLALDSDRGGRSAAVRRGARSAVVVPPTRSVVVARTALAVLGVGFGLWGLRLLLHSLSVDALFRLPIWLGGAVLADDFFLVPLTIGAGWLLTRWSIGPDHHRTVTTIRTTLLYAGITTLVAIPLLLRQGKGINPTALPRDYFRDWLLLEATIVAIGVLVIVIQRRRSTSRGLRAQRRLMLRGLKGQRRLMLRRSRASSGDMEGR